MRIKSESHTIYWYLSYLTALFHLQILYNVEYDGKLIMTDE